MEATLIGISGTLLLLLIGVIAYFLRRFISSVDRLDTTVDMLSSTVIDLHASVATNIEICKLRHKQLDKDIAEIKEQIK